MLNPRFKGHGLPDPEIVATTKQYLYEEARRVVIANEHHTVVLEATGPFLDDLNLIVKYCKAITSWKEGIQSILLKFYYGLILD